ncbi:hypothetical protein C4577_07665 [Candidatus Parcubacteria bacterium]|nr:MAG: hypothetical protein C4577_07665 [Candidatus Parcubacteria bacterium]
MFKYIVVNIFFLLFLFFPNYVIAGVQSSFITVVNPVRGEEFWEEKQTVTEVIKGQRQIIEEANIPASWLIRFDALKNQSVIEELRSLPQTHEKGLFLEVTPLWTKSSDVDYRQSFAWHSAESVLLTGYTANEREKLIDKAFSEFQSIFGYYPTSIGAWYLDSYSLEYMQGKYSITSALIVADQYTTDNYQIWGQYWSSPFYPSAKNTLIPAQSKEDKIPVVVTQWASRDPVNGYGGGVQESTYSVQANDYIDYHDLDINYFSKLVDIFTQQRYNPVNQLVVGLENSYSWSKYESEYYKQIQLIAKKKTQGSLRVETLSSFASWYKDSFPEISPEQIVIADDPLGRGGKAIWYMNPYYRVGWFYNNEGSVIRDLRQYVQGQVEPCYDKVCPSVNFATFATRVLDDVTYNQKLLIDQGKITDFSITKLKDYFVISYLNEAGKQRDIQFMPRDISINGRISSIDGLIMETQNSYKDGQEKIHLTSGSTEKFKETFFEFIFKVVSFVIFVGFVFLVPGYIFVKKLKQKEKSFNIFVSISLGLVGLTLMSLIGGYLKMFGLIWVYIAVLVVAFIFQKNYKDIQPVLFVKNIYRSLFFMILIILGTIFQNIGTARSGWVYDLGVGYWGPTGHDGIWHQALINQLTLKVPPDNPGFAGVSLSNYHYFFDLLVAASFKITGIPINDLLYRLYPILFSLLLGLGVYVLVNRLFQNKLATFISLFFIYFGGSFGWIVEFIKTKSIWGGESAFWANQPVSMNLNPPFAISLVLLTAFLLVFNVFIKEKNKTSYLILILLAGLLIEFKVYAGILVLAGLGLVAFIKIIQKEISYLVVFVGSLLVSLIVFLPQDKGAEGLLVLSPFWFIHTMIDFTDRVGWVRLSMGREAYVARGEWLKFFFVEGLGLLIFTIGNLGMRVLGLSVFISNVRRRISGEETLMYGVITLASFIIPLFFVQKGNTWNSIQFIYYFMFIMALFTGGVVTGFYQRCGKVTGSIIIILILAITPISALATFKGYFSNFPHARLTANELEALTFLHSQPQGIVLTVPYDKNLRLKFAEPYPLMVYETSAYVSAFSGKPTFIEDEIQQEILQIDYKKRLVEAKNFFSGKDLIWSKEFLKKNNIKYLYIPKIFNIALPDKRLELILIFNNNEVEIMEVS